MKKIILLFVVALISFVGNAQVPRVKFIYDDAGNQILRTYCPSCAAKGAKQEQE